MPLARSYTVKNFTPGLVTRLEAESLPRGASSDDKNWLALGDHIELRRGISLMGTNVIGTGGITGLHKGVRFDGVEKLFATYARKVRYYDEDTVDWSELGTDTLPSAANGEDTSFTSYHSLAGAAVYLSSPNSSIYKIMVANPGSITDLLSTTYRGKIRIKKGTMFLWDRKDTAGGSDKTGLYRSWGDKDQLADYTNTTKEDVGTGDGVTLVHTGTLAFRAARPKRTCMYVIIAAPITAGTSITNITQATQAVVTSAGHGLAVGDPIIITNVAGMTQINNLIGQVVAVSGNDVTVNINSSGFSAYSSGGTLHKAERFIDDRNGAMSSLPGGTGTINYTTGAFSLTFATAPASGKDLIADYYEEDPTDNDAGTSNSGAVADFTSSATRQANEGLALRQDDGGAEMQNMGTIAGSEFCLHTRKTYKLDIAANDTDITNLIYRDRVGIPYWRAMAETGDGIYYIDAIDQNEPAFRILELSQYSTDIIPRSISEKLILSDYRFDTAVVYEWGAYLIFECRHKNSTVNDTAFFYHKSWECFNKLEIRASCYEEYSGDLVFGDAASRNVFRLFDGVSDEEAAIDNHWTSAETDLDISGVKEVNLLVLRGLIQIDQVLKILLSYDGGDFVEVGEIDGGGDYVNRGGRFYIGSHGIGVEKIGEAGAGVGDSGIEVAPYAREMRINTDRFEKVRIKFVAEEVGFVSVSEYTYKDIRLKGQSLPTQYIVD